MLTVIAVLVAALNVTCVFAALILASPRAGTGMYIVSPFFPLCDNLVTKLATTRFDL